MHGIPTDERLRCVRCGEVIGAYEPLVALLDGRTRNTSKAAEAGGDGALGECYHRACYALAYAEPSPD
jgi:hypothetical protein